MDQSYVGKHAVLKGIAGVYRSLSAGSPDPLANESLVVRRPGNWKPTIEKRSGRLTPALGEGRGEAGSKAIRSAAMRAQGRNATDLLHVKLGP